MKYTSAFILSLASLYSAYSFAMFCPTNFNQINIGDTIKQVQDQCGKPETSKNTTSEANQPQEWTFYVPVPTDPYTMGYNPNAGTMKVTMAFVDGKVVNMTSNGIGVGATALCGGANLQLGSTIKDVKTACGKPAMVNKTNMGTEGGAPQPNEISEWKYTGPTGTTTLIFENGKLKERK